MFENFSHRSRQLFQEAENEARRLGHLQIRSGHFLLPLLDNSLPPDPVPDLGQLLLRELKVSPERTRLRLVNSLGANNRPIYGRVRLSSEARTMILDAEKERVRTNSLELFSHHFILGALANTKCMAGQLLICEGVTLIKARQSVATINLRVAEQLKLMSDLRP